MAAEASKYKRKPSTAACLRLTLVLVVVARWPTNMDAILLLLVVFVLS